MPASVIYQLPASTSDEDCNNMSKVNLNEAAFNCSSGNVTGQGSTSCGSNASGIGLALSMMILGVTGNIIALVIIYSSRGESQCRRTVFFVMLAGLAWSDLTAQFCVSTVPNLVYLNNLKWVGGVPLCRYHGFGMTSFGLITPLIVSCMSIERFLAIRFSYFYARHITKRKAQVGFLVCILIALVFSSFPFLGFGSYERQHPGSWCFFNFHRETPVDAAYAFCFALICILAICVMLFCNIAVVITLFIMRQSRKVNNSPSFDRRISVSQISHSGGAVIRSKKHSDLEAQMIWFLCLITVSFSVCWLPFNIYIIIRQFSDKGSIELDVLFIRMVGWNQILDPWLYVIFRKSSFLRLLTSIKRILHLKRKTADDLINAALRNPDLRKRSRTSTMEVSTFNRTMGNGFSRGTINMEENLENLKKILETERKLGREMYSRISEKTEYSESVTQTDGGLGSRHASVKEDPRYTSVDSKNKREITAGKDAICNHVVQDEKSTEIDPYTHQIEEHDLVTDAEICLPSTHQHQHRPCTNTKSCPVKGSEPMVFTVTDRCGSSQKHRPVGRQLSMPASSFSHSGEDLLSSHSHPSSYLHSKSSLCNSMGKSNGHCSSSLASLSSGAKIQGYRLPRNLDLIDMQSISVEDVFSTADAEAAILLEEEESERESQSQKSLSESPRHCGKNKAYSHCLPKGSASDSQELLA